MYILYRYINIIVNLRMQDNIRQNYKHLYSIKNIYKYLINSFVKKNRILKKDYY